MWQLLLSWLVKWKLIEKIPLRSIDLRQFCFVSQEIVAILVNN